MSNLQMNYMICFTFLFYSIAILRYLSRKYNVADHWYPKDSKKQARVDEYLEWQHANTRADCALYYLHKVLSDSHHSYS
jgi:glutathione S-transferase